MKSNATFNHLENTKIYNGFYGWAGETKVKVSGKNWVIATCKRSSGIISTHCHVVQDEGNGNFSYMMFSQDKTESFWLNQLPKGTKATEKAIREAHFKALAEFDAKQEAGELPTAKEEYKIEIGQIVFTEGPAYPVNRRAIYEINGNKYKTVLLDGSCTKHDEHIRPIAKRFGIGTYYREGDKITTDEISNLLIDAHRNMEIKAADDKIKAEQASKEKAEKEAYLSQFTRADRRKTTAILKAHIIKTWPIVSKVEIRTEFNTMDVVYHAPAEIVELNNFISSFKEGSFNGMNDLYEYDNNRAEIIIEKHILQTYKYVYHKFVQASEVREVKEAAPVTAPEIAEGPKTEGLKLVNYSEKALAIFGDTKPVKGTLRALGGSFNAYLTNPETGTRQAGWIFSKKREAEIKKALGL